MTRTLMAALALVATLAAPVPAQSSRQAEITLQAAMAAEVVEGNLTKAVALYERALREAGSDRALAARALLLLGQALERGGRIGEARTQYDVIARTYADQREAARAARERLVVTDVAVQDSFPSRVFDPSYVVDEAVREMELSPDGRLAAFGRLAGSERQMTSSLVIRTLADDAEYVVASELAGRVNGLRGLRFSPDGRHVAASMQVYSGAGPRRNDGYREMLAVADVSGQSGPPVVVSTVEGPGFANNGPSYAWSPDSRTVAYLAGQDGTEALEVRVLDVSTGQSRLLARYPAPSAPPPVSSGLADFQWSPDGDRLARRVVTGSGADELRVIDIRSGGERRVPLPEAGHDRLRLSDWTTTDRIIVHRSHNNDPTSTRVTLVAPETGQITDVCVGAVPDRPRRVFYGEGGGGDECLGVSRDGTTVLRWDASSSQLFVRDIPSGRDRTLTLGSGEEHMGFMSPDGDVVAFVSNRDGRWGLYAAAVANAPSHRPALLTELDGLPRYLVLAWKGDGLVAQIVYAGMDLWRVDMDPATGRAAGPLYRLTQDTPVNSNPAVSPDGRTIAYLSMRRARQGLSVMDADGANEREVPTSMLPGPLVAWRAPDEVFTMLFPAPGQRIRQFVAVNVETRQLTPVSASGLETTEVQHFQNLPAQNELAYLTVPDEAGRQELRARSLSSGRDRVLSAHDQAGWRVVGFLVSPDEKRVAFVTRTVGAPGQPVQAETRLMDLTNGEQRVLADRARVLAAWSPDGRFLLSGGARPQVVDIVTGDEWPLMRNPDDQPAWNQGSASWSPDESYLVLAVPASRADVRQWSGISAEAVTRVAAGR